MESDLEQQQQAPTQVNSSGGLTRYRSAPSSYFNNIIDREFYEHVFNRPSSPETERDFSRFMNSLGSEVEEDSSSLKVKEEEVINNNEHEHVVLQQQHQQQSNINNISNENYNSVPTTHQRQQHPLGTFYQKPPLPNVGNQNQNHSSNLIRHSSSPAGLFSQINIENGYVVGMRGMGEAKFSNARSLKSQSNYSSGLMSPISEIGEKSNRENNLDSEAFAESHGNDFITDYQVGPWDDLSVNVGGLKRFVDHDSKPFSGLNAAAATQNESGGQSHSPLVHQLSMPNTSAEMAAIEKFLHFSDAVPCKIRAKRGCATHPRSIAERVRRTKISERMRKLQDLVPNMDKQTNTSDMLDLAVDYIKDLQKEVQTLSDCQAKCTCSHKQQQ